MRQVSGRFTNLFSNRAFFLTRFTRRLYVLFFFQIIYKVSGDNFASIPWPPLFDRTRSFVKISRWGGINGAIYRCLINDFWDAFFDSFQGGGTLFIYFHTLGSLEGWVRSGVLVVCILGADIIFRSTGLTGFTVSALRGRCCF